MPSNRAGGRAALHRTTRFTMLLHLPRMDGYGAGPRVKNAPALAGHGAQAVRDAIAAPSPPSPASCAGH